MSSNSISIRGPGYSGINVETRTMMITGQTNKKPQTQKEKEEQQEQEREYQRATKRLAGQIIEINDKTKNMLSEIDKPVVIPYKGVSFDNAISKVLKYYNNNHKVGHIEKVDYTDIERIGEESRRKTDPFSSSPISSENSKKSQIHIEEITYQDLKHVTKTFFPPYAELHYDHDIVLERCIEFYNKSSINNKMVNKA